MIFQKPPMSTIEQHRAAIGSHASRISSSSWRLSSKRRKEKTDHTSSCSSCSSLPTKVRLLAAILILLGSVPLLLPPSSSMVAQVHYPYILSFMYYFPGTSQGKFTWIPAACPLPIEQFGGCRSNFLTFRTLLLSRLWREVHVEVIKHQVFLWVVTSQKF